MITVTVTVAGAGQFTDTLITDFLAEGPFDGDQNIQAKLIGVFYNSQGTAHQFSCFLATAGGVALNLTGIIFAATATATANSAFNACGAYGIVIPRTTGSILPYTLRMTTLGKDNDGTVTCWYTKGPIR